MSTTTEFKDWFDGIELSYWGDIESLADAINGEGKVGSFKFEKARGSDDRWVLTEDSHDETLLIASEKARRTLLSYIEQRYCNGEDVYGWCSFTRAMEKDD